MRAWPKNRPELIVVGWTKMRYDDYGDSHMVPGSDEITIGIKGNKSPTWQAGGKEGNEE